MLYSSSLLEAMQRDPFPQPATRVSPLPTGMKQRTESALGGDRDLETGEATVGVLKQETLTLELFSLEVRVLLQREMLVEMLFGCLLSLESLRVWSHSCMLSSE